MTTIGGLGLIEMLKSLSEPCDCEDCQDQRERSGGRDGPARTQDIQARVVFDSYLKLIEPIEKKPGTLLVLKKGLFSGYRFSEDAVVVISRVFETPLRSDEKSGTNHYGRDLDIAVLAISNSEVHGENVVEFAVDSRFFEPYTGPVA